MFEELVINKGHFYVKKLKCTKRPIFSVYFNNYLNYIIYN